MRDYGDSTTFVFSMHGADRAGSGLGLTRRVDQNFTIVPWTQQLPALSLTTGAHTCMVIH